MGPLSGRHILLTRPREEQCALGGQLASWGAHVLSIPMIEVFNVNTVMPTGEYHWLFFTSQNAVHAVLDNLTYREALQKQGWRIATVGSATAERVMAYQLPVAFIAQVFEASHAAAEFLSRYGGEAPHVLWPCGNLADPAFSDQLRAGGMAVTPWVVYETRRRTVLVESEQQALASTPLDLVAFTSASAVEAYASLGLPVDGIQIASIGPKTSKAVQKLFGRVDIQAEPYTLSALAEAIRVYYQTGESK